jgi:hypothetical protein
MKNLANHGTLATIGLRQYALDYDMTRMVHQDVFQAPFKYCNNIHCIHAIQ